MADPGPQLQKVLDFRKSLEVSQQVLSHGFANGAEFKAEVDRHLRAFAKGELPQADAPRDKVLLPVAVIAEVQKEKVEKEQALIPTGSAPIVPSATSQMRVKSPPTGYARKAPRSKRVFRVL